MAGLEFIGVRKTYPNGFKAIHGVDTSVADGAFIVIVGPSGCGKSTLLRMVAGLETVTEGEIRIGGRRVNALEPADRNIAMVFQNYALYPHMSVFDNMAYGLRNRRTAKDEIQRRVADASRILQLDGLLDRRPSQLSGGQRQRVAMGRAIVREPEVFLFDEPLSNLDAKLRVQMRLEIKRLQRDLGTTSLYVTHDQVEAMTLADRLIVMNAGVAEQIGSPLDVYEAAGHGVRGRVHRLAGDELPGGDARRGRAGGGARRLGPGPAVSAARLRSPRQGDGRHAPRSIWSPSPAMPRPWSWPWTWWRRWERTAWCTGSLPAAAGTATTDATVRTARAVLCMGDRPAAAGDPW